MVMYTTQVLNSFIFNRYEFNRNKAEAIVYFLTSKKYKDLKEMQMYSGDIKIQFNRLIDVCKNKDEQECFEYFMELGVNYDIIEDLVKMIQYVKNFINNNNSQSKYVYINNNSNKDEVKDTKIFDNTMV